MPPMIAIGRGGLVDASRIVAAASARSAPVKRLLRSVEPQRILNLTYGYPRWSVLLFDNGMLAVVSVRLETLRELLGQQMEIIDVEPDET